MRRALLAVLLLGTSSPARADSGAGPAEAARAVLARHCVRCHGPDSPGEGGFTSAADLGRLAAGELIVAGDPDRSELYRRLRAGEMPPRKVAVRPAADEIEAVRAWIAAGAPVPAGARVAIGWAGIDRAIAADLVALPGGERSHARYLSIAHWRDAGRPDEELARARRAAERLLASLTWEPRVPALVPIDPAATIFRIDLRALGWSPLLWDDLAARDPFAVRRRSADALAAHRATGTQVPCVRIDWLVAAAARPPLYHHILGLPDRLDELAARLGVDLEDDLRRGAVMRAGFARSGVSRHNRVIERHALPGGGYLWRSYDFAGSTARRNVFEHPLGPGDDAGEFAADGGEVIFSLPDGMQGYFLVDGRGRRLDRAPTTIVLDRARADAAVENGISCMGCHGDGVIAKADELRAHVDANQAAFEAREPGMARRLRALHPAADVLAARFAADRARFAAAVAAAGGADPVEPIDWVARRFEAPLALADAAAELGLSADALRARLTPSLRRRLGGMVLPGGTAARDTFQTGFPGIVARLGLGAALRGEPEAVRLVDSCDDGSPLDCQRAGNAFFRGDGVPADRARAAELYGAACRRGLATGCTAVAIANPRADVDGFFRAGCERGDLRGCELGGRRLLPAAPSRAIGLLGRACPQRRSACAPLTLAHHLAACRRGAGGRCGSAADMIQDGNGVAADRGGAATLRDRGCHLRDAESCRKLALQYRWGQGVTIDWLRSAELLVRACELGAVRACLWH